MTTALISAMNLNRASYFSPATVPVDLLRVPWVGEEGEEFASHYYRARYYDSKLGRFVSEDPISLAGGLNLFSYVRGRPTLLTDPSGLRPNSNSIWYMCCYNGAVAPCRGFQPNFADTCVKKCELKHEAMHRDDARVCGKDLCKGKPDYYIIRAPEDLPVPTVKKWECSAWRDTLECVANCQYNAEVDFVLKLAVRMIRANCGTTP